MSDEYWTVEDEIEAALKPCPRCGSKAILDDGNSDGIHCDGCGYWTGEDMDRDEAIEWWNMQPYITFLLSRIDELAVALVVEQAQVAELHQQLEAARAGSYVPVDTNSLTYHFGKESYMLDGEPIIMLELPPTVRLCRLQPFGVSPRTEAGRWVESGGETPKPASAGSYVPVPDGPIGPGISLRNRVIWFECHNSGILHGYALQDGEMLMRGGAGATTGSGERCEP